MLARGDGAETLRGNVGRVTVHNLRRVLVKLLIVGLGLAAVGCPMAEEPRRLADAKAGREHELDVERSRAEHKPLHDKEPVDLAHLHARVVDVGPLETDLSECNTVAENRQTAVEGKWREQLADDDDPTRRRRLVEERRHNDRRNERVSEHVEVASDGGGRRFVEERREEEHRGDKNVAPDEQKEKDRGRRVERPVPKPEDGTHDPERDGDGKVEDKRDDVVDEVVGDHAEAHDFHDLAELVLFLVDDGREQRGELQLEHKDVEERADERDEIERVRLVAGGEVLEPSERGRVEPARKRRDRGRGEQRRVAHVVESRRERVVEEHGDAELMVHRVEDMEHVATERVEAHK
eukprot:Amastigsp_a508623_729.p2 type:complete len:350 gc:universal Amastigsp_a508623_729:1804-755(-)